MFPLQPAQQWSSLYDFEWAVRRLYCQLCSGLAIALAAAAIAAALATATATAAALAATAIAATVSAGDRGGEHRGQPDKCTRQHRRRPHRPGPRHLQPHRGAQRHAECRPRGGGGRLGRAGCTSELLESAPCAGHQPGLVGRRASDRAQHHQGVLPHRRISRWWWCHCPFWHSDHLIMHHKWEHS